MLDIVCKKVDEVVPPGNVQELSRFFEGSFFDFPLRNDVRLKKRVAVYTLLRLRLQALFSQNDSLDALRLTYPRSGVLCIDVRGKSEKVWVNVSYSGDYVMTGISSVPIGVDVQKVRRVPDALVEALSSSQEASFAYGFSLRERTQFFSLKESFAKAVQLGITWPGHYAVYSKEFIVDSSIEGVVSRPVQLEDEDHVASVSMVPETALSKLERRA